MESCTSPKLTVVQSDWIRQAGASNKQSESPSTSFLHLPRGFLIPLYCKLLPLLLPLLVCCFWVLFESGSGTGENLFLRWTLQLRGWLLVIVFSCRTWFAIQGHCFHSAILCVCDHITYQFRNSLLNLLLFELHVVICGSLAYWNFSSGSRAPRCSHRLKPHLRVEPRAAFRWGDLHVCIIIELHGIYCIVSIYNGGQRRLGQAGHEQGRVE